MQTLVHQPYLLHPVQSPLRILTDHPVPETVKPSIALLENYSSYDKEKGIKKNLHLLMC